MIAGLQQLRHFLSHRPLVWGALAVASGSAMASLLSFSFPWLTAVTCASGLLALAARKSTLSRIPSRFLFFFLVTCTWVLLHPANRFATPSLPPGAISVSGTIRTDPSIRPVRNGQAWLWTFELGDWTVKHDPSPARQAPLLMTWFAPNRTSGPRFGETWSFEGACKEPGRNRALRVVSARRMSRRIAGSEGNWLATQCYAGRHAAESCLSRGLEDRPEASAILRALLLGYRGHLTPESREVFTATGTLHIFAISGLHVGIVALLITRVLRVLRISRVSWVLILAPLLITYTIATGARPSAVRACIMAITLFLAPLVGRRADPACAVSLAAILLLAWDPHHIQDIGFIYTFVVVAGLLILTPRFEAPMKRLYHRPTPDQVNPTVTRALSRGELLRETSRNAWRVFLRGFCGLAALSCAAWLISTPLTAYWFGRIAPVALLANILVVPIAFAIVLIGCLSVLCGACLPFLSIGFNAVNVLIIELLFRILRLCAALPLASMEIKPPSLWAVFLCYTGIGLLALALPSTVRSAGARALPSPAAPEDG